MREIIEWLLSVERSAASFYQEVARKAGADGSISQFFHEMAKEETWHFQVMKNALTYLENNVAPAPAIIVDISTKEKIEGAFDRNRALLAGGDFTMERVLDCVATTEFSEWNDIFVYVVNHLREEREFMSVAARMQQHIREVENFLESLREGRRYAYVLRSLPPVWQERILIIDDDQAIVEFLKRLFSHNGHIETAFNGEEGLRKVRESYYDVIISDIQMPVMDGIEFYEQASAYDLGIADRILFFTGATRPEHIDFLQRERVRYLMKPAPIREILRKVGEIIPSVNKEG